MTNQALIYFNHELKLNGFSDGVREFFGLDARAYSWEKVELVVNNNPEFITFLDELRNSKRCESEKSMKLVLLDNQTLNIHIEGFVVHQISQANHYMLVLLPESKRRNIVVNLERSLKFNVINKLAASIAHEIRNPLSSLAIHTEVLDNTFSNLPANQDQKMRIEKSIQILHSELHRVSRIIDQFFNLARSNGGKPNYEDINAIMMDVFDLIKQQCYENNIKVDLDLGRNLPFVYIYRNKIIQALLNIIINSLEAMSPGDVLHMMTKKMNGYLQVAIKDNGCGITRESQERIFDLYYSNKTEAGGVGLFLAKKIIEAHNGKIKIQSKHEEGSTFTIEIPTASKF